MSTVGPPVGITDIVIHGTTEFAKDSLGNTVEHLSVGECFDLEADETTQLERLNQTIQGLMDVGYEEYLKKCDQDGNLKPEDKGNVVRLVTHEFCFYTKTPLAIGEFEKLQQDINEHAKTRPQNLHLILSSFAVKTPDDKVMNVVAQVQCGEDPKFDFIVKQNPSCGDPTYKLSRDDRKFTLPNIGKYEENNSRYRLNEDNISGLNINIDGHEHKFSYNNITECSAENGGKYISCIDICIDHKRNEGQSRLKSHLEEQAKLSATGESEGLIPLQCSQVVTSNHTLLMPEHMMGTVTHADPNQAKAPWGPKVELGTNLENRSVIKSQVPFEQSVELKLPFGPALQKTVTANRIVDTLKEENLHNANLNNQNVALKAEGKSLESFQKYVPQINQVTPEEENPKPSADSDIDILYYESVAKEHAFDDEYIIEGWARDHAQDSEFSNPFSNPFSQPFSNPFSQPISGTDGATANPRDDKTNMQQMGHYLDNLESKAQDAKATGQYVPHSKVPVDNGTPNKEDELPKIAAGYAKQNDMNGLMDMFEYINHHDGHALGDVRFQFQNEQEQHQFCQIVQNTIETGRSKAFEENGVGGLTAIHELKRKLEQYMESKGMNKDGLKEGLNSFKHFEPDDSTNNLLSAFKKDVEVMKKAKSELPLTSKPDAPSPFSMSTPSTSSETPKTSSKFRNK